jgi:hypothetical protein
MAIDILADNPEAHSLNNREGHSSKGQLISPNMPPTLACY